MITRHKRQCSSRLYYEYAWRGGQMGGEDQSGAGRPPIKQHGGKPFGGHNL